jgi:glutamate formiminotransferase
MDDCVALARRLGARIGDELEIPVFLYGAAAARPERENLAEVRRGGFESMRDISPDFGPPRMHPTAGATAVGARNLLVAYNVYLDTPDVGIAKSIASAIRTRSGGLPSVRALGMLVNGTAQVSTNLLNVDQTPPATVFASISSEAERKGARAVRSELVGLCPERVLSADVARYIRLDSDREAHLLEPALRAAVGNVAPL